MCAGQGGAASLFCSLVINSLRLKTRKKIFLDSKLPVCDIYIYTHTYFFFVSPLVNYNFGYRIYLFIYYHFMIRIIVALDFLRQKTCDTLTNS